MAIVSELQRVLNQILSNITKPRPVISYLQDSKVDMSLEQFEGLVIESQKASDASQHELWSVFKSAFNIWDMATTLGDEEILATQPSSIDRKNAIFRTLKFTEATEAQVRLALGASQPQSRIPSHMEMASSNLWGQVESYLVSKKKNKLSEDAAQLLDRESEIVLNRILEAQARGLQRSTAVKGLVVGHVQSGKTMNMIALSAKAIDRGFNLVIVLAGDRDLLRSQTQRRFDSDLIGRNAAYKVVDSRRPIEEQPEAEYQAQVIEHFINVPRSHVRLTGLNEDFIQKTKTSAFLKADQLSKNTVFVVVKKQHDQIRALHKAIHEANAMVSSVARQGIRALILDDECDHATPRAASHEARETNTQIRNLLGEVPNSCYVGYTATPYSTICINRGPEDVYPDDFVHVLEQSPEYFGYEKFFNLNVFSPEIEDDGTNEKRFVRLPKSETKKTPVENKNPKVARKYESRSLSDAIDMFVVTGAIKLWRNSAPNDRYDYAYHTMLCHESHEKDDHRAVAKRVQEIWKRKSYDLKGGLPLLFDDKIINRFNKCLVDLNEFGGDSDHPLPTSVDDLRFHIQRFLEIANLPSVVQSSENPQKHEHDAPIMVVNSNQSLRWSWDHLSELESLRRVRLRKSAADLEMAKIVIGGNVLSRGYTIEGLTISYFGRCTLQLDSLLQMERWLGYRNMYFELMRLYIEPGSGKRDHYSGRDILNRLRRVSAVDRDVRTLLMSREAEWHQHKNSIIAELKTISLGGTVLTGRSNGWTQSYFTYRGECVPFGQLGINSTTHRNNHEAFVQLAKSSDNLVRVTAKTRRTLKESAPLDNANLQSTTWWVGDLKSSDVDDWAKAVSEDEKNLVIGTQILNEAKAKGLKFKILIATKASRDANYAPIEIGPEVQLYPNTVGEIGIEGNHFVQMKMVGGGYSRALEGALGIDQSVLRPDDELAKLPGFWNSRDVSRREEKFIALVFQSVYQKVLSEGDNTDRRSLALPVIYPSIQIPSWVEDLEGKEFSFKRVPKKMRKPKADAVQG